MSMTVKKWLKDVYYDQQGQMIFSIKDGHCQMIADIRGWGAIQHLFDESVKAENFQDEVGQFIVDAIKEKLNKDQ